MTTTVDRVYRPRGAADELLDAFEPEVALVGPANTGKSRGVAEALFRDLARNPGCRIAVVRKTRKSLTESFLPMWENEVLAGGLDVSYLTKDSNLSIGAGRANRHSYTFQNGSELVLGSLENKMSLFSTQWDKIYVQEAVEIELDDYESLLRGLRNKKIPHPLGGIDPLSGEPRNFNQLICDSNPGDPRSWLKRRIDAGVIRLIVCRHSDNPRFSQADQDKLDRMTGVRRARLRDGLWVSAEGAIWGDSWDPAIHILPRMPEVRIVRHIASQDWGYTSAGVLLVGAMDDKGRLYVRRQVYQCEKKIDWWRTKALHAKVEFGYQTIQCDHTPGNIAEYRDVGLPATEADKEIMVGLDAVRDRLHAADDGAPRLFVIADSLDEVDPLLRETGRATCLEDEIPGYVYAKSADGRWIKEEPAKNQDDHGCDALRYMVRYADRVTSNERTPPPKYAAGTFGNVMGWNDNPIFAEDGEAVGA